MNELTSAALALITLKDNLKRNTVTDANRASAVEVVEYAISVITDEARAQETAQQKTTSLDRQGRLHWLQETQSAVDRLRYTYSDSQMEFWGLLIAWEALRFAWYVVSGDRATARAKLELIESAITDWKERDR